MESLNLPLATEIQKRVNDRYDELFHECPSGDRLPYVCCICDEFILKLSNKGEVTFDAMKKMKDVLSWKSFKDDRRTKELEEYFQFDVSKSVVDTRTDFLFLKEMCLSPRGVLRNVQRGRTKYKFIVCKRCEGCVKKKTLPRHAILNNNYVGGAPACLMELTEVELALLSPVRGYGFCFTWIGGRQRSLKGTMTFMRVEKRRIASAVLQLEHMGFNDHVLCLYTGEITRWQKKRAKELSTIRTAKVFAALEFLVACNPRWSNVDLQEMREDLSNKTPVVYDRSFEVESENSNIESEEIFTCYYPDGATNPTNGGFSEPEGFKTYVEEMAQKGFDVEFQCELQQQFVTDGDADILVDACLQQFPYGIGHMKENRRLPDGSWTDRSDLLEYLQHLSTIAQPVFQTNFFQLVLYSLACKTWLLTSSRLSLRGKTTAENLANHLTVEDVKSCITGRQLGNKYFGTQASQSLLNAVDATSKNLPHTNEASKRAAGTNESMQHHFGMSSIFATVTFDDENSFLLQVMCGNIVDDNRAVDSLTDLECCERVSKRRCLRIKYPGIATMNFEVLLDILMYEVIGWDMKGNKATDHVGYFGVPGALSFAVEEQGRTTIHVHMSIWIRIVKEWQEDIFFGNQRQKTSAIWNMQSYSERICSTEMFPQDHTILRKAWDHDCTVPRSVRSIPLVVPNQDLRNLRNRAGYKDSNGLFAFCEHCDKTWTYEQLLNQYLRSEVLVCPPVTDSSSGMFDNSEQIPKARMMAKIIEYQKTKNTQMAPKECISATYQHHLSCHVKNCFKCKKKGTKKRGHVCGPSCECRYRMPDMKRRRAELLVEQESVRWYNWNGSYKEQPLMMVLPQRRQYDLFQNVSCDAISFSKFSCNNNTSVVLDGPIGMYQYKYQTKEQQKEETADYSELLSSVKRFASDDRKHELDRPEALRRICAASFAHNRTNVISATMASYLLRQGTRFYVSHEFLYCPLKDLIRLHNKQDIQGTLKYAPEGDCFFENFALHYLCRHDSLNDISLRTFTETFLVQNVTKRNEDEILAFTPDTGFYQHPSVLKSGRRKGLCGQGLICRQEVGFMRVCQWMFPDTASFKANIVDCPESEMNNKMEEYAQLVLTLFLPHRHAGDLKVSWATPFPYVHKLQEVYQRDVMAKRWGEPMVVFTDQNTNFLQNLQNCRSNSLRYKMNGDELSNCTVPYQSPNPQDADNNFQEEEEPEIEETAYELFKHQIEQEVVCGSTTDNDPEFLNSTLQNFTFTKMKNKGKDNCGYDHQVEVKKIMEHVQDFVKHRFNIDSRLGDNENPTEQYHERRTYSVQDIVQLHLKRNLPKLDKEVWKDKSVKVSPATGSIKSIREWTRACLGGDKNQERAFEVLISSFLLTFYEESPEDNSDATNENSRYRSKYRRMLLALRKLRGIGNAHNLICLLHGPGGSGKSTVINLVKAYAADYCASLGHSYTNRTIIVTAMSGVAATLLSGETTHSVLGLNRDSVQNEEAAEWVDARLLIVDECSFASQHDFEKMHEHLKYFMKEHHKMYGGLNIVFAGDYSQLEPVGRDPIYENDNYCAEFHGALNCFIELDGMWRFAKDRNYGEIMKRFREGNPTYEDIDLLNNECLTTNKTPPPEIQVATYTNKDRDAINGAIFDDWTKMNRPADGSVLLSACIVFMDGLSMNDSSKTSVPVTSNAVKRFFYENCTESECNFGSNGRGRVDPCLKLYYDAPMMLTQNTDVGNGEANGSRVHVKCIRLKGGEESFVLKLDNGTEVLGCYASQVDALVLEHENENITPRRFELLSQAFNFKCRLQVGVEELYVGVQGTQFPLISNSCTTGHKLQGCTVESILANTWYYGANWAYVVLSRVKTMDGLHMRRALSKDLKKYKKPEAMKRMLDDFHTKIAVEMLDDEDYVELEKVELVHDENAHQDNDVFEVSVPY